MPLKRTPVCFAKNADELENQKGTGVPPIHTPVRFPKIPAELKAQKAWACLSGHTPMPPLHPQFLFLPFPHPGPIPRPSNPDPKAVYMTPNLTRVKENVPCVQDTISRTL